MNCDGIESDESIMGTLVTEWGEGESDNSCTLLAWPPFVLELVELDGTTCWW